MRLTEKVELFNGVKTHKKLSTISQQELVLKLGQLEDIEEELGIDLITLFKIMEQLKINIELFSGDSYCLMPDGKTIETDMGYVMGFIAYVREMIRNHGKTWVLTKE